MLYTVLKAGRSASTRLSLWTEATTLHHGRVRLLEALA